MLMNCSALLLWGPSSEPSHNDTHGTLRHSFYHPLCLRNPSPLNLLPLNPNVQHSSAPIHSTLSSLRFPPMFPSLLSKLSRQICGFFSSASKEEVIVFDSELMACGED